LQQNVEMHLREHHFPQDKIREYIQDIFGWTETCGLYHESLVDFSDITIFDTALQSLKERWKVMPLMIANHIKMLFTVDF